MTPEEEAGLIEAGQTQEEIDALKAAEAPNPAEEAQKAAEAPNPAEEAQKAAEAQAEKDKIISSLTPEDVEKTPHFRQMAFNIREEKRREAERAQLLEQDNQRLKQEAEERQREAERIVNEDTEQILTVGEFNKRVDAKVAQLEKAAEKRRMQSEAVGIQQRLNEADERGRAEFTVEKMGAGLDFDSVFKGTERQIMENPEYRNVILKAKDPAKEAYRIGLLDPAIANIRDAHVRESTLTKIKGGGQPPKGGGGGASGGGGGDDLSIEELINLSPEELDRRTLALEKQGG